MTILAAMQSAAIKLVGYRPSVFFSSQEQFEQEIVDLIKEAAADISKYNDWQSLVSVKNFVGDGVTESFDIPAGYDRMMLTASIQDPNNWVWGYNYAGSIDDFLWMKDRGWGPYPGVWTIYGDQFNFYPAPSGGAQFPYITKYIAKGSDGSLKDSFTDDNDEFRIRDGERLLTLWLVWRWRENKKMDATGDMENFTKAIDELAAKDRGSRVYRSGTSRNWGNTRIAWPYLLG
jgi:hypothetical protein